MTLMSAQQRLSQLDELIDRQEQLNREIRRQFGPIGGPLRPLTIDDRRRARALIADLTGLIEQMALACTEAERTAHLRLRTTNASLAYLTTGRQLARRVLRTTT